MLGILSTPSKKRPRVRGWVSVAFRRPYLQILNHTSIVFFSRMPSLSQLDSSVVARFPLDDGLQFLQDRLRDVDESRDGSGSIGQAAVSLLLTALMGQKAAYHLSSKTCSGGNLAGELLKVLNRVQTEPFIYDRFRTLSLLVISRRSDVDIWTAVFDLISTFSNVTPPPSAPASFDETPVTRSSSSFQGSEQTRKILDPALFNEIQHCTYRNVEGFFVKYFENKSWDGKSEKIFRAIKRGKKQKKKWYHVGRWTGISDRPSEERMWEWLSRFQAEFLHDSSGVFCVARNTKELSGGEAKRQLDVVMKKRTEEEVLDEEKHNWKDVCVIGELKQSENDFKSLLLQLSRYARDVFTAQPTRPFLHAFTMQGRTMELWVFDRSGAYSSGEFDIHKEPEKLIKVMIGYANMSDAELGLDTYTEFKGIDRFIDVSADASVKRKKLQLETSPFVKQRAIVCRGTTCFRTIEPRNVVVKFSWTSDKRQRESDLLRLAHKKGVKGVAKFVGYEQLTTINDLRSGMTFPPRHRFRATAGNVSGSLSISRSFGAFQRLSVSTTKRKHNEQDRTNCKRSRSNSQPSKLHRQSQASNRSFSTGTSLYETDSSMYSNRIFGCLAISPAGRALSTFRSVRELLTVLRDGAETHRALFMEADILHRDVSEYNVIITDPAEANGFTGILIDLDLAKLRGSGRSGARHQTGTVEFMAIQVLQKVAHTYRHDLESFFYVLLWICARRAWEVEYLCSKSERPKESRLRRWYSGTFDQIAEAKRGYMHVDGLEDILKEFPPALEMVKPLCRRIRKILFPLRQSGELDTGTHTIAEELYPKFIAAFDDSLAELDLQTDP